MAREYRKASARASSPQAVDKSSVLGGRVSIELPVGVAEVIGGVSEEIERLAGQAGLLIMKAMMDAEVESLAGPKGRHDPDRTSTRWTAQPGYVVLVITLRVALSRTPVPYEKTVLFQTNPPGIATLSKSTPTSRPRAGAWGSNWEAAGATWNG